MDGCERIEDYRAGMSVPMRHRTHGIYNAWRIWEATDASLIACSVHSRSAAQEVPRGDHPSLHLSSLPSGRPFRIVSPIRTEQPFAHTYSRLDGYRGRQFCGRAIRGPTRPAVPQPAYSCTLERPAGKHLSKRVSTRSSANIGLAENVRLWHCPLRCILTARGGTPRFIVG